MDPRVDKVARILVSYSVEIKPGGIVLVEGQVVELGEKKMLVHSIVSDLVAAIDVISLRDKEFIAIHPTVQ